MEVKQIKRTAKAPVLKKVCAYARVSTGKDAMLHSLAAQVDYYSTLIRHTPGWEYVGVYTDEAKTGTKDSCEGFHQMIVDALNGKIDMIIVKSISRFARNTVTLLDIVRELKAAGVDVFFEEQNTYTMSAEGELMLTILASFAQEESRSISENMKWRIKRNFEAGMPWDGTLIGYRLVDGEYVIKPDKAETVRFIFSEYLSGKGGPGIAAELNKREIPTRLGNKWCNTTVIGVLTNYTYTGNLILQKTFRENHMSKRKLPNNGQFAKYHVENSHEAIISMDDFLKVQEAVARRKELYYTDTNGKNTYPLSGKIICGICGTNYKRKTRRNKIKWICQTYNSKGKRACPSKQVPEKILLDIVSEYGGADNIKNIIVNPKNELIVVLTSGEEHTLHWQDESRRDSWTPEMKEKARERAKEQCRCRHKEM